jgi:probable FeS assembly SUF system protein SufT
MNEAPTAASISLSRPVKATRIPSGDPVDFASGTLVMITQALGGSFTVVIPGQGGLYRIEREFADALGQDLAGLDLQTDGPVTEDHVWTVLKTCYDPEIPVNIVDLGLIYSLQLEPAPSGLGTAVFAEMTLTAAGCGMGPVIAREAQTKISQIPGVTSATVQVVWEPAWTPALISEEGKKKLGMI